MKKYKKYSIAALVLAMLLTAALCLGGCAAQPQGSDTPAAGSSSSQEIQAPSVSLPQEEAPEQRPERPEEPPVTQPQEEESVPTVEEPQKENPPQADPAPEANPLPEEPQDAQVEDAALTCTISISCATILDNLDACAPEKVELVPEDGWLLEPTQVTFYQGESVFHVLQRTCKQNGIHMEYENTPIYNSAYMEGIGNLYELDVGELSGWQYKVNDWFPNYGCSRYQLQEGDEIAWVYTCDLGQDVGGANVLEG